MTTLACAVPRVLTCDGGAALGPRVGITKLSVILTLDSCAGGCTLLPIFIRDLNSMVGLAGVGYVGVEPCQSVIPDVVVIMRDIWSSGGVVTIPQDTLQVVRLQIELLAPLTG